MTLRPFSLLLALSALLSMPVQAQQQVTVSNAWIREAPPTAQVMAGYLTIGNQGTDSVTITSADSDDFGAVEIHRSVVRDGMASMQPAGDLAIGPGETLLLEPGGYHLMLIRPARPLRAGDQATIRLHTRNGPCIILDATVERRDTEYHAH